jgi:hypothetical protein
MPTELEGLFEKAACTTHAVDQHCARATALLDEPRAQAGAGELIDPRQVNNHLLAVRHEIDAALSLMSATTWPTAADYEALRTVRKGR